MTYASFIYIIKDVLESFSENYSHNILKLYETFRVFWLLSIETDVKRTKFIYWSDVIISHQWNELLDAPRSISHLTAPNLSAFNPQAVGILNLACFKAFEEYLSWSEFRWITFMPIFIIFRENSKSRFW